MVVETRVKQRCQEEASTPVVGSEGVAGAT